MDNSPFAKLPTELRTRIFEEAVRASPRWLTAYIDDDNGSVSLGDVERAWKQSLALSTTCRALHQEVDPLFFFAAKWFTFRGNALKSGDSCGERLRLFRDAISERFGESANQALRYIVVPIDFPPRRAYRDRFLPCLREVRRIALQHPCCATCVRVLFPHPDRSTLSLFLTELSCGWSTARECISKLPESKREEMNEHADTLNFWRAELAKVTLDTTAS